jgi:hypothetical protein
MKMNQQKKKEFEKLFNFCRRQVKAQKVEADFRVFAEKKKNFRPFKSWSS